MSISKTWLGNPENTKKAVELYRERSFPTVETIAAMLGTTPQTVSRALRSALSDAERKALAAVRYSVSKTGAKNPMKGKRGMAHPKWIGECADGYGYLTCLHEGKRKFVHRVVMAEALGLQELPAHLDVHHIDDDKANNSLDNLALVTRGGHLAIHSRQLREPRSAELKRSTIAEAVRSMTSP